MALAWTSNGAGRMDLTRPFSDISTRREAKAAEERVLHLDELIDAVLGALAPDAGLFHAAERHDFRGDEPFIDADDAVFETFHDAPHAPHVSRKEVRGEPVFGVVGKLQSFLLRLELVEGRDRP